MYSFNLPDRMFHLDGTLPQFGEVFVYGSNTRGAHGLGAAKVAVDEYGARYGVGQGHQGYSYGICTKDTDGGDKLVVLPLEVIHRNVEEFVDFTFQHQHMEFFVTSIGCGYAGYQPWQIAHMFRHAQRCSFPHTWVAHL